MDFSKLLHNPFVMEHTPEISNGQWLTVRGIGFLLVMFVIIRWIWPSMIQPHLNNRKADIIETAHQVEVTLSETEAMRADYEIRLHKIEDEQRARLEEAVHEADALKQQIVAEGEAAANAILRRSEEEASRERAKSLLTLKRNFVEGVIGAAQHAAEVGIDSAGHKKLVDEFVTGLGVAS